MFFANQLSEFRIPVPNSVRLGSGFWFGNGWDPHVGALQDFRFQNVSVGLELTTPRLAGRVHDELQLPALVVPGDLVTGGDRGKPALWA